MKWLTTSGPSCCKHVPSPCRTVRPMICLMWPGGCSHDHAIFSALSVQCSALSTSSAWLTSGGWKGTRPRQRDPIRWLAVWDFCKTCNWFERICGARLIFSGPNIVNIYRDQAMECDIEAVITLRHGPLLSSRVTSSNPAAHTPRPPARDWIKRKIIHQPKTQHSVVLSALVRRQRVWGCEVVARSLGSTLCWPDVTSELSSKYRWEPVRDIVQLSCQCTPSSHNTARSNTNNPQQQRDQPLTVFSRRRNIPVWEKSNQYRRVFSISVVVQLG